MANLLLNKPRSVNGWLEDHDQHPPCPCIRQRLSSDGTEQLSEKHEALPAAPCQEPHFKFRHVSTLPSSFTFNSLVNSFRTTDAVEWPKVPVSSKSVVARALEQCELYGGSMKAPENTNIAKKTSNKTYVLSNARKAVHCGLSITFNL
jgi:hypothetical protein